MKRRSSKLIVLYSAAVGLGFGIAASTAVMAEEPAQKPDATAQKTDGAVAQADGTIQKLETPKADAVSPLQRQAEYTPSTGSNIRRYRPQDTSLPHVELDRSYIDRSGATNATELLRTVPQITVVK